MSEIDAQAILTEIGDRIRQARLHANLTQSELAHAVGYSAANPVCKIEVGRVGRLEVGLLAQVASTCDVELSWLIEPAIEASKKSRPARRKK